MTDLKALVERIEGASEGSWALDWAIHLRDGLDGKGMYGSHPYYTASLDAAMQLVPEGCGWIAAWGQIRAEERWAALELRAMLGLSVTMPTMM